MGVIAPVRELVQRLGFFERRQVLALEVLDQRQLHHLPIVNLADDDRHVAQADLDGGVVAALTSDDLVAGAALADDQRLDDPLFRHRCHQLRQVAHDLARLIGIRVQQLDRHEAADGLTRGGRQRLHVVLVMPHPERFRQSALRHAR